MYFKQADIFWGMRKDFVKEIMKISVAESYKKGELLFREGSPANRFFILLKGCVKLSIGEAGPVVHVVSNAGEAFGWSSLLGREVYSASAECLIQTKLLKFDNARLQKILEKDPANGLVFFKRLALTLGGRLFQSYQMLSSATQTAVFPSFGTGQILATLETEPEQEGY